MGSIWSSCSHVSYVAVVWLRWKSERPKYAFDNKTAITRTTRLHKHIPIEEGLSSLLKVQQKPRIPGRDFPIVFYDEKSAQQQLEEALYSRMNLNDVLRCYLNTQELSGKVRKRSARANGCDMDQEDLQRITLAYLKSSILGNGTLRIDNETLRLVGKLGLGTEETPPKEFIKLDDVRDSNCVYNLDGTRYLDDAFKLAESMLPNQDEEVIDPKPIQNLSLQMLREINDPKALLGKFFCRYLGRSHQLTVGMFFGPEEEDQPTPPVIEKRYDLPLDPITNLGFYMLDCKMVDGSVKQTVISVNWDKPNGPAFLFQLLEPWIIGLDIDLTRCREIKVTKIGR
jgi:hypothetical protein